MARSKNSKVMALDDGELAFTAAGQYSFDVIGNGQIKLKLSAGQSTILTRAEYDSITKLNIGQDAHVTMGAEALVGITITGLEGSLDITGVDFSEAGPSGGFETSVNLDTVIGSAIDAHGAGHVAGHLTVDGSQTEAFKLLWDYLDDGYTAGNNYYDLDLNENFVRLGIEYVNYLAAGGEPLTFVMAKFTADGGDADELPERAQSMHDNLLGNLTTAALNDRFASNPALLQELKDLIPDEYEARPYFEGNDGDVGGAHHDGARAFDYEKGWDRPDYIERTADGTVDQRAWDQAEGDMIYGDGNPVTGWSIVRHEGAGVELALKAKERFGADYDPVQIDPDGTVHYNVAGEEGSPDTAKWNFDFAISTGISNQDETLSEFAFRLLVDLDATEGTNFVEIDPSLLGVGNARTAQGSQNVGFDYLQDNIDMDPNTDGIQRYDLGPGEFDFVLEAYDGGNLIASNTIVVHVDDYGLV